MDRQYPTEAWRRLGKALEARRGQLGYGFRQRGAFLADRGGPPPSVKTLARLERGERATYPDATVTQLESLYGWARGSFEAVLEGGEAEPLPATPGSVPLRPVPLPRIVTAGSPAQEILDDLMTRYAADDVIAAMGAQRGKPPWMLVQEILRWLERQGDEDPAREVLAGIKAARPDDEVLQVIGRQRGKKASMVTAEILEWLSWTPPEMEQGNGTAG